MHLKFYKYLANYVNLFFIMCSHLIFKFSFINKKKLLAKVIKLFMNIPI